MKISGSRTVRAPAQAVWGFLMDPAQLRGCLPGCERFDARTPEEFVAEMRLGVGFLKGTYHGSVRVTEQQPPARLGLAVEGSGALGSLSADGIVHFREDDGVTYLTYDGEAHVGGRIAALGERVISATASRLIALFFDCLAHHVERG